MVKMLLLPLLAASVLAVAFMSIATPFRSTAGAPPSVGEWPASYVIDFGTSVKLPDGSVLGFVEVVEDSRCPADAMCIWQGRAVVAFTLDGERFEVEYLGEAQVVKEGGVQIAVRDVQPYPLASQPAEVEDYEVTVTVA